MSNFQWWFIRQIHSLTHLQSHVLHSFIQSFTPSSFHPLLVPWLLLLLLLEPWCHVFILIHRSRRCRLKRIPWLLSTTAGHIVNLNKFATVISALSMSSASSATSVLGQHGQPLLLPYLGCVRLALRIRLPCWGPELVLDAWAAGLKGINKYTE